MSTRYENIVNASRDFITLISKDYKYEFANDSYCVEIGKKREDIVDHTIEEVWGSEKFEKRIKRHVDSALNGQESHDIDRFLWGGMYKYIHVSYYPYVEDGAITSVMVYSHDISQIKNLESRLIDYEFKDQITGLFNRKSFDIVLDMELEKARRSREERLRAVIFITLRNLTEVNIQYGHEIGDLILESTGIRIKETLRASDFIFRFDGHEFAAILTTLRRESDVATIADKLQGRIHLPYPNKAGNINLVCNMGVAVFPNDGDEKVKLVRNALSAMNDSKEQNETFVIYNQDLHKKSLAKLRTKADIRSALVSDQFDLRFQPIFDLDKKLLGAEALIRWKHPDGSWVSPSYFIPIAEETGDAIMIDRWVLFKVCSYLQDWLPIFGDRYVSINLSAREFEKEGQIEDIIEILGSFASIPRSCLKLEITETQSMEDIEGAINKINRFKEAGIGVFIDDFGSGYSSLGYLKRIPAEAIKIDKAFVDTIADNEEDEAFLRSMVGMVQSKKKHVLIEGVETAAQLRILKTMPGLRIQGYYFSQPLSPMEFAVLLQQQIR